MEDPDSKNSTVAMEIPLHPRGQTPLHFAAENGHGSVAERLLVASAAVDTCDRNGRSLGIVYGPMERGLDEGIWEWIHDFVKSRAHLSEQC